MHGDKHVKKATCVLAPFEMPGRALTNRMGAARTLEMSLGDELPNVAPFISHRSLPYERSNVSFTDSFPQTAV